MIFSHPFLKKYLKKGISPKKLVELLTFRSLETEFEEKDSKRLLEVDILPNRYPDCASYIGLAREINALLNYPPEGKTAFEGKEFEASKKIKRTNIPKIKIENEDDCLLYSGVLIEKVKVGESPNWLKDFLLANNIKPHNNIVDLANFVMLETGQPLHTFDARTIGEEINVRRARKGEKITTFEGEEVSLDEDILVIADNKKPVAIAGIKGGRETGVTTETRSIFIEAANFSPALIYKSSKKLNIISDASQRYAHGLPLGLAEKGLFKLVNLVIENAGGTIKGFIRQGSNKSKKTRVVGFNVERFRSLIGLDIPPKEAKRILFLLGFKYLGQKNKFYLFRVPWWRLDIERPEDLYEEVSRFVGYRNISSTVPLALIEPPKRNDRINLRREIKRDLASLGFSEIYGYSLTSLGDLEAGGYKRKEVLKLRNPISRKFEYLRPTLAFSLLRAASLNFKYLDDVRLFEMGKVFEKGGAKVIERENIAGLIAFKKTGEEMFFLLKGLVMRILENLGLDKEDYSFARASSPGKIGKGSLLASEKIFYPLKLAVLSNNREIFGIMGEVKPSLLSFFQINTSLGQRKSRVAFFELDFEFLLSLIREEREYQPISPYPAVVRDISLLVDKGVRIEDVLAAIETSGAKHLEDSDLFDVYYESKLGGNKKSLAFHLVFQSQSHTLKSREVEDDLEKIRKVLERNFKAKVR